jgi:hypothetical protein
MAKFTACDGFTLLDNVSTLCLPATHCWFPKIRKEEGKQHDVMPFLPSLCVRKRAWSGDRETVCEAQQVRQDSTNSRQAYLLVFPDRQCLLASFRRLSLAETDYEAQQMSPRVIDLASLSLCVRK